MARTARKQSESGIFHVMLRGIDRQVIFQDDEDCEKYLQCLATCKEISGFTLYAYCLMGNHLHLLIQEGTEPLSLIFKRIGVRYVYWYNYKYQRTGHLFQDRFKSEPINDDAYFLAVLRYIYQNPVKAGICKKPEEYLWSSYNQEFVHNPLVNGEKLSELIGEKKFVSFMEEISDQSFIDVDHNGRMNDREATAKIKELCRLSTVTDFIFLDKELQRNYLSQLHQEGCSIRQLARLTGLTKRKIEWMLN